jgi:protein arginine N-methyltransferase 1
MDIDFHRKMLADAARNEAFHAALAKVIRKGETRVLDLGTGTCLLAFFAARLGAREVIACERAEVIELAKQLARANGIDGIRFLHGDIRDYSGILKVDVIVSEVLGNFAHEENIVESLNHASRYLVPGGIVIPARVESWCAPLASPRLADELASFRRLGHGLDFALAERMARENTYVKRIEPGELLEVQPERWDDLILAAGGSQGRPNGRPLANKSRRAGAVRFAIPRAAAIHGFALWWEATLVDGISLSTSPFAPPTHWEQVFVPVLESIDCRGGDIVGLNIESDSSGGQGAWVRWQLAHEREGQTIGEQAMDSRRGYF